MKMPFVGFVMAIGFAALAACSSHRPQVSLRDFNWSVIGDTAPFSFELENATAKQVDVSVFVVAGSRRESRAGTLLRDVGREKIEVSLGPREKKKIAGQVHLASAGDIALQTFVSVKKPNQSLEPTAMLGTSAAEQPLVPSTAVAHL